MEWDKKRKLVELGNNSLTSLKNKKEYQDYVLQNISEFDIQAWDIFITISDIRAIDIKNDSDYWKAVYKHLIKIDFNSYNFSFISSLRIRLITSICETELDLSDNNEKKT